MIDTDIHLQNEEYAAAISSKRGGTCFRLFHKQSSREILRFPKDEEALQASVFLYGNPILFPCNRIRGGEFTFEGRRYAFPVNEPSTDCHIHGALYKLPFVVVEQTERSVTLRYQARAGEYLNFPHAFAVERAYELTHEGLTERTSFENLSKQTMPLMLAFHTTFLAKDCYFRAPVIEEQLRDKHFLPTGEYAKDRAREREMQRGEYPVGEAHLSALYRLEGDGVAITDGKYEVEYVASKEYGYRMLYAEKGAGFLVAEPQTCAIDCFHLATPPEENGLLRLLPNEKINLYTCIKIKKSLEDNKA